MCCSEGGCCGGSCKYKGTCIRNLGWTLIVLASIGAILAAIADGVYAGYPFAVVHHISAPIWGGLFIIVAGGLAVCGGKSPENACLKLTLETFHHAEAAEKVVEGDIYPPLRVAHYWRPGAPKAGLMMYAKIGGEWEKVGWVREKNRQAVLEMAGGDGVEALTVTLLEKYIKRGYCVLKVEVL